uniref:Short chain dehydrogenase n=1 Tax=Ditylenchus dipsaci TaxID=166011 RepID=A0A915DX25_9BILA
MEAQWFSPHLAYSMSKIGMSMCVLGMSQEFRPLGIAVNALWPRTIIWTSALKMVASSMNINQECSRNRKLS